MKAMKSFLMMACVLALAACREDKTQTADPVDSMRAIGAVYEAAKAEGLARAKSSGDGASPSAMAEYQVAARRLDEAKERARSAGFSDLEIRARALSGSEDASTGIAEELRANN